MPDRTYRDFASGESYTVSEGGKAPAPQEVILNGESLGMAYGWLQVFDMLSKRGFTNRAELILKAERKEGKLIINTKGKQ